MPLPQILFNAVVDFIVQGISMNDDDDSNKTVTTRKPFVAAASHSDEVLILAILFSLKHWLRHIKIRRTA